jgi:hypothetical protein
MEIILLIVGGYLAFHFLSGMVHHQRRKSRGLSPNFYWSSVRGPYGSIRLPGGFRVGHKL